MDFIEDVTADLIASAQTCHQVCMDVETSGLDEHSDILLLVQFYFDNGKGYVVNAGKASKKKLAYILKLLDERKVEVIGHNLKFDLKFLYKNYGVLLHTTFDTQVANSIAFQGLTTRFVSLSKLCETYLGIELNKSTRETFIGKSDFEFTDEQVRYSFEDVYVLFELKEKFVDLLNSRGQADTFYSIEMPLLPVVAKMEFDGISFDIEKWQALAEKAKKDEEDHARELYSIVAESFRDLVKSKNALEACKDLKIPTNTMRKAEKERLKNITVFDDIKAEVLPMINWSSPYQPKVILNKLGVPVKTTDKKELQHFQDQFKIVELILHVRGDSKKVDTYGDDFLKHVNPFTGCIHTSLHQDGAGTGRFSSSKPNLQNIIAENVYRECFIARPGMKLMTFDYSNIELRIIAETAREPIMIDLFNDDGDLHSLTASLLFDVPIADVTKDQRKFAKSLNFAVVYGSTARGIAYTFNMSIKEASDYLKKYFRIYHILKLFIDRFADHCLKVGYAVTMSGRKRFLKYPLNPKTDAEFRQIYKARRQAVNTLPQGTSADMIKLALKYMHYGSPFPDDKFRPLLTVHDEIVTEVHYSILDEADAFIEDCMVRAGQKYLKLVPIKVGRVIEDYWVKD